MENLDIIDKRLIVFIDTIQHLDNTENEGITREQLLHPKLRSWITGDYPKTPIGLTDEQWKMIWGVFEHRALEFHKDVVYQSEKGKKLEYIFEDYSEFDCKLWTIWFDLAFADETTETTEITEITETT